jgi:hypothetical protein
MTMLWSSVSQAGILLVRNSFDRSASSPDVSNTAKVQVLWLVCQVLTSSLSRWLAAARNVSVVVEVPAPVPPYAYGRQAGADNRAPFLRGPRAERGSCLPAKEPTWHRQPQARTFPFTLVLSFTDM